MGESWKRITIAMKHPNKATPYKTLSKTLVRSELAGNPNTRVGRKRKAQIAAHIPRGKVMRERSPEKTRNTNTAIQINTGKTCRFIPKRRVLSHMAAAKNMAATPIKREKEREKKIGNNTASNTTAVA